MSVETQLAARLVSRLHVLSASAAQFLGGKSITNATDLGRLDALARVLTDRPYRPGASLQELMLQERMLHQDRVFAMVSNALKAKQETDQNTIDNVR